MRQTQGSFLRVRNGLKLLNLEYFVDNIESIITGVSYGNYRVS
jgi:hypothetical protein